MAKQTTAELAWDPTPVVVPEETGNWVHWFSQCGGYRVSRLERTLDDDVRFGACWKNIPAPQPRKGKGSDIPQEKPPSPFWDSCEVVAAGSGYPRHYKTLEEALRAVERFHSTQTGEETESNRKAVLDGAAQKGWDRRRSSAPSGEEKKVARKREKKTMVKINREEAIHLLVALGHPRSKIDAASEGNLTKRLKALDELPDDDMASKLADNEKAATTAKTVLEAISSGDEMIVVAPGAAESNGHAASPKGKTKGDKEKSPKKEKASKGGDKKEQDAFGSRLGTNRAKVNAVFSRKPMTVSEITAAAGLANFSCHQHLKELLEAGKIIKMEDGYALPPKAKKAQLVEA